MLLLSAGRASSTCDSSGWLNSHWRRKQRRHLCTLSSTAVWTTVTHWSQWSSATKAARLINGARRSEHMTPALRDLHWLQVRQRITFKTAVLMFKCLHDMAPQYLPTYCKPVSACTDRRHLQSVQFHLLTVPCTSTNYDDRSFAVHRPRAWNSLPVELRSFAVHVDLVHGTVFLWNCVHWTCLTRSDMSWRIFCSLRNCWLSTFVALCNLALYKIL